MRMAWRAGVGEPTAAEVLRAVGGREDAIARPASWSRSKDRRARSLQAASLPSRRLVARPSDERAGPRAELVE
jgi:hypothetical protein